MSIDPALLDVVACPRDKGPLTYDADADLLINPRLHIAYRIDDGIPVLLADEAVDYPETN